MHVALNAWFWNAVNTGSGQYLRRLVYWLTKIAPQLQITLIMPPHHPNPTDVPPDVRIHPTQGSGSKIGKVWFEQVTFPRAVKQVKADIAHVPYWGAPLSCSVPLVTSVLDVIPLLYPIYSMGFFNRLYTQLVSTSAQGSTHILTISETSKLDIEYWLNIPSERVTVTYLAPDEQYHPLMGKERDEAVRQKYHLPDKFVLYIGGFDARKRVKDLLTAYTYVSEAQGANLPLVIAGREPQWSLPVFPNLREYADAMELGDLVQWIGFVEEEDKPSLLRLAEVFVFPSEYEGFGLPPLEAMACGTPTVTSDAVIFDELLENGAYQVSNPRDMAGAIIALIIQDPFREALRNQGLAQATKYNWRKTAKKTLEVYEKVLKL